VTSRHNLWIAEFLPWFSCPDIFSKELGISKRQATRARKPAGDRGRRAAKDTFLTKTQQFRSPLS
jgi:hypothetical protein